MGKPLGMPIFFLLPFSKSNLLALSLRSLSAASMLDDVYRVKIRDLAQYPTGYSHAKMGLWAWQWHWLCCCIAEHREVHKHDIDIWLSTICYEYIWITCCENQSALTKTTTSPWLESGNPQMNKYTISTSEGLMHLDMYTHTVKTFNYECNVYVSIYI